MKKKRTQASAPLGLEPLISREVLAARVAEMGAEIGKSIHPRERPVAVVVLQGAFVFAADILRHVPARLGIQIAFLRCSSYGSAKKSSGKVVLMHDLDAELDLHGRTVLLIDDILDTGHTLNFLAAHMKQRGAKRIRICVLLTRKGSNHAGQRAEFCDFKIGKEFVVGYGLDYAGKHRHLPDLYAKR